MLNIFQYKAVNVFLKLLATVSLLWVLYYELFEKTDASALLGIFNTQWRSSNWIWLLPAVALLPVNWLLESVKWRLLIYIFYPISLLRALKGVIAGVTLSLPTPNRVGDYGGRILAVPAAYNWYAVITTMIGSYAQLLVLLTGGLAGVLYFIKLHSEWPQLLLNGFWWIGFLLLLIAYFFFFNVQHLSKLIRLFPIPKRFIKTYRYIYKLRYFTREQLLKALSVSFLRYLVYSFQYYCMACFWGIEAPFLGAMSGIATIFLIQSSIPLPPLAALLARGEAAIIIWGHFSGDKLGILGATFSLFILNLCLPALLGLAVIMRINVLKSLGYVQRIPENSQSDRADGPRYGFHSNRTPE
jgi:hypothetical protein